MPEAQIPIMLMTPNKSMMEEKSKVKAHPQWQPYAFDCQEFSITPEQEKESEYCQFRRWLISKVSNA